MLRLQGDTPMSDEIDFYAEIYSDELAELQRIESLADLDD